MPVTFSAQEFNWDEHNVNKNWRKHGVRFTECEDVFFDERLTILPDVMHSEMEPRHLALGQTREGRLLFIAFTVRADKIRVISARDMTKKEKKVYYEKTKTNPSL